MAHALRAAFVRPLMSAWIRYSPDSWRDFPRPTDEPHVSIPGADPIRLVILGGGANMGYGAATHQVSFGGQLGRQLARTTKRGVDVRIVAIRELSLRRASRYLPDSAENIDAVVTTVGSAEAYRLETASTWIRQLRHFLSVAAEQDPRTQVFFGGIIAPGSLVSAPAVARELIAERVDILNKASREVCGRAKQAVYVPFPKRVAIGEGSSAIDQYGAGAANFSEAVAGWLGS